MLRKSVVLFLTKQGGPFNPVGSGTLVFYEGRGLIISAAHVFEDLIGKEVYLHVLDRIYQLKSLKIMLSNKMPFNGNRELDPLDIGAMVVPDNILDDLDGEVSYVERDFIETATNHAEIKCYQALGFPGAKNTKHADKAFHSRNPFIPELLIYSGEDIKSQVFPHKRFSDKYHIAMRFKEESNLTDDLSKINAPKPNGMSGGLIQGCFDYVPHSHGLYPTCAAAILIEREKKANAIFGVKFSIIFEWLDLHKAKI